MSPRLVKILACNSIAVAIGHFRLIDGLAESIGHKLKELCAENGEFVYYTPFPLSFETGYWFLVHILFIAVLVTIIQYWITFLVVRVFSATLAGNRRFVGSIWNWTCLGGLPVVIGILACQILSAVRISEFPPKLFGIGLWTLLTFTLAMARFRYLVNRRSLVFRCKKCRKIRVDLIAPFCSECGHLIRNVPMCHVCNYFLIDHASDNCPECGTPIEKDQPPPESR